MTMNDANDKNNGGASGAGKEAGSKAGENDGGEKAGKSAELLAAEQRIAQLEADAKGKDKKINEQQQVLKGYQEKENEAKSAEEKYSDAQKRLKYLEQRDSYRVEFKGSDIDADEAHNILNEADPIERAKKFKEVLAREKKKAADNAVESFKKEQLEKTAGKIPGAGKEGNSDKADELANKMRAAAQY